jgi:hypothetical protein
MPDKLVGTRLTTGGNSKEVKRTGNANSRKSTNACNTPCLSLTVNQDLGFVRSNHPDKIRNGLRPNSSRLLRKRARIDSTSNTTKYTLLQRVHQPNGTHAF